MGAGKMHMDELWFRPVACIPGKTMPKPRIR